MASSVSKYLSPDERKAWADLLDRALNGSRRADAAAVDRAMAALRDCDEPWAAVVRERMLHEGTRRALVTCAKSEAMVLVAHNGQVLAKTSRRGVVTVAADGRSEHQQMLWQEMSWEQFETWHRLNESQIGGLLANRTASRKLAALRDLVPDSIGPGDAASKLGTSLDAVLAS